MIKHVRFRQIMRDFKGEFIMKDISKMTWIIIITSFVLLTILIGTTTKFVQKLTYKEVIAVEVNSEQIEDGIELEKESKSTDHFTTYKSYPATSIKSIDEPIYKWAKEKENAFLKEVDTYLKDDKKNVTSNFHLESDIYKVTDNLFSIKVETESNIDESKTRQDLKTFIVDTENKKIINNEEVFNNENFSTKERFQLIVHHFDEEIDFNHWEAALDDLNELNLHFNKDKISFYFNGENVNEKDDIITVEVPTIEFADYYTENYYNTFMSEEMEQELQQAKIEEEEAKEDEVQGHQYIALTFDDGPDPATTSQILNTLEQYDAKATFFMLSRSAQAYPQTAKKVADHGHEIANHSISHIDFNTVYEPRIRQEMTESKQQIENITGKTPKLFRPPYGSKNDTVTNIAIESDQSIAMWSLDTYDWQHKNPSVTLDKIKNNAKPGSIILMHDIHQQTADALPQVMEYLQSQGFEFVTMSELLPYIEGEGVGPYYGNE